MASLRLPRAHCALARQFRSKPLPDETRIRLQIYLRFRRVPNIDGWEKRRPTPFELCRWQHRRKPTGCWYLLCRRPGSSFEIPPPAAIVLQQLVSFFRPPRAGWVVREMTRRERFPNIENWTDHAPTGLDHIGPLEQRRIADHAIVQQTLVSGAGLRSEVVGVLEIHIDSPQSHDRPRNLRRELQRNSFFWLNVKHQLIWHQVLDRRVAEQHEWRAPELDDDVRVLRCKPFSRTNIERNISPAPVVNQQLHGDKGLGLRIRCDALFFTIARHPLGILRARAILSAHCAR